jgi:hypothetical protein
MSIIIPSIRLTPPRTGLSSYREIREYMLRPTYLEGDLKGQRLRKYQYVLVDKDRVIKDVLDGEFHVHFLSKNGVDHWTISDLYLVIYDLEENVSLWTIPASTAAFICEVWKPEQKSPKEYAMEFAHYLEYVDPSSRKSTEQLYKDFIGTN